MANFLRIVILLLVAALFAATPRAARAAQSYDGCAGFIDSLPTTISTQGVWCLHHDLSTSIASGSAVTIAANNVTIDCNDFKIGGLAAGDGSAADGVFATNRLNVTVRHCDIRGFYNGIAIANGGDQLVEDNRLDNNLYVGIYVGGGDGNLVRRNRVNDTGGATGSSISYGIYANADVVDNTVTNTFAGTANPSSIGIRLEGYGTLAGRNRVRELFSSGSGAARGIMVSASAALIEDNLVAGYAPGSNSAGIYGAGTNAFCRDNTIVDFASAISNCTDAGGNAGN